MGRFPQSAAAPLGRDVTAGGGPAFLDPRVRAFPTGPILGHQCVAYNDGWLVEEFLGPVDVRGPRYPQPLAQPAIRLSGPLPTFTPARNHLRRLPWDLPRPETCP